MDDKKCLGQKIKAVRKLKKMTQEQLSERIDISPRQMVKIEMGQVYPSLDTFKKICTALEVQSQFLLENDYFDDIETLKEKIYEKVKTLDEKNTRFLYIIASNCDLLS